jgi:SiaC family regulatory phosphoprotein
LETYKIEAADDTPEIDLDAQNLVFRITGTSTPENAVEFYAPVVDWIDDNKKNLTDKLLCEFNFKYLSSSSHKMIYEILSQLEELVNKENGVEVIWKYKEIDEDMLEVGEDFDALLKIPFKFITL